MQYTLSDFTKWAEENVQSGDFSWRKAIEMFQESRKPKPDWEILSFKGTLSTNQELCTKGDDALFRFAGGWPTYGFRKEDMISRDDYAIHHVRRSCDSRLFSVGDHVQYEDHRGIVNEFHVNYKGQMEVHCNDGTIVFPLEDLKLLPPVLFTTVDGKTISDGDYVWRTNADFGDIKRYEISAKCYRSQVGNATFTFSTKAAAMEYIKKNKPVLSFNDILDAFAKANVSGQFYGDSMEEIYKLVNTRIGFNEPGSGS